MSKKKIIFLTLSIFLVILILFSSSYALLFNVNETEKQSYTTGVLDITSESINNSVTLNNQLPMTDSDGANTTPYVFRITNKGNLSYKFNIMLLSTTTNNQISAEYIKIKVDDNEIISLNNLTNGIILSDITLKPNDYIDVSLRVWLDINTPNTQIGKTFNAKITTEGQAVYTENKAMETLTNLGLTANTDTPDFSKTSCSDCFDESTVGIYESEDDFGTSYYFRGDVENNYVYFAGYYWRIIRINGDGSIRMIYDGTSAHANGESSTDRSIGSVSFNNSSYDDNAYVGYMYGTAGSTSYDVTHKNTSFSTIKTYLDNWYETNIKGTTNERYIVDAIYCNDREITTVDSNYTGNGTGANKTLYKTYERLVINKSPTLKCNQVNDRFTMNTNINGLEGNGALSHPISLLTADEVAYAGGVYNTSNSKYYLYTSNWFWLLSPYDFGGYSATMFILNSFGSFEHEGVIYSHDIRPVISISSTAINSGTGTMTAPFEVEESKHTLSKLKLVTNTDTPDFSKTSCSEGCEESTIGLYETEDDLGTSYYFRGDVENNYVYFAGYYWRIIRINGDGSIRMVYAGTNLYPNGYDDSNTKDMNIGTSEFNNSYFDNAYIGYMYGKTGSSSNTYAETHTNTFDSTVKTTIDNWYNINIKGTTNEKYIVDAIYCNDRGVSTIDSNYTGDGIYLFDTAYKPWERLIINKAPTLKCSQENDRFTKYKNIDKVVGNGALTYSIGLITADEVAYAGGVYNKINSKYYLYTNETFWTMSPFIFFSDQGANIIVDSNEKGINNVKANYLNYTVRPVITLSSTALTKGTGTMTDPFKIN